VSKARLVITAIEVEGRSPAEVVAAYGVSRSWLYELLARYRPEGDVAFEPSPRDDYQPTGRPPGAAANDGRRTHNAWVRASAMS
jgi:transposase